MAAQLSWLWFSVHGLFPVSSSKSSGKRVVGASAGSVLQMNCLKFWRFMKCSIYCKCSLVCSTDDWPYVFILYGTLQMLLLLLCLSPSHVLSCLLATTNSNMHSEPHINLHYTVNAYNTPTSQGYCVRMDSYGNCKKIHSPTSNSQSNSFICKYVN